MKTQIRLDLYLSLKKIFFWRDVYLVYIYSFYNFIFLIKIKFNIYDIIYINKNIKFF